MCKLICINRVFASVEHQCLLFFTFCPVEATFLPDSEPNDICASLSVHLQLFGGYLPSIFIFMHFKSA